MQGAMFVRVEGEEGQFAIRCCAGGGARRPRAGQLSSETSTGFCNSLRMTERPSGTDTFMSSCPQPLRIWKGQRNPAR